MCGEVPVEKWDALLLGSAFAYPGGCPGVHLESGETYVRNSLLFLDKAGCIPC